MIVKSHRFTFIKKKKKLQHSPATQAKHETNIILSNTFILLEHPIRDIQYFLSMRRVQTSLNLYKKLHTCLRITYDEKTQKIPCPSLLKFISVTFTILCIWTEINLQDIQSGHKY